MDLSHDKTPAGLPLLATKHFAPRWRPSLVSRPHLLARLNQGTGGTLTLIAAPAGFGKSTLLGEWLALRPETERPAAWVSLDSGDNDPALFWAYVVTALRRVLPEVGASALSLLQSPHPPPIELILTALINELAAIEDGITLVLDDLHVVDSVPIHTGIAFLLDHLPPRMRLVIASRADPPLPLARLRSHGDLTEIRATDLRFTADEAAIFLTEAMGLDLSAKDIAALEARTEGWIAGLQMAALSLRGRPDVTGFVASFTGDDRYILDYLIEEVLQRQPERVRTFLLETAVLDRLNGSLCDAVTGGQDGARLLESLERGNLFVVPLDDKRRWYRYHHLFADVLRAHGTGESPDRVITRHLRASAWYEQNGSTADAIHHALAAGDVARVADLVEMAIPAMRRNRQEATLLGWCRSLPDELIRQRPVLSAEFAAALLSTGTLDGVEERLGDVEGWLETIDETQPESTGAKVVVNEAEFRRLPGAIAVYRAGLALARGDLPATETLARRAVELVASDDYISHGAAAAILGLAAWATGDLDAAHRSYSEGMAFLLRAGYVADSVGGTIALADIRIAQGRPRDALSTYERALQFVHEQGEPVLRGISDLHVGIGELLTERNDLDTATHHLLMSKELGEHLGFPQNPYRWRVAMAQISLARGDFDGAIELLDEAERRYFGDFAPYVRPISAMRARVWVIQGRLSEALRWTKEQSLSTDDDLTYLREYAHITLARVLIAQNWQRANQETGNELSAFLERLLISAESGGRMRSVIELLLLQALMQSKPGQGARALGLIERALTLAEPENYVRMFVNEGERMRDLLRLAAAKGIASAYTRQLLDAFNDPDSLPSSPPQVQASVLAEPLTARELEILRLIAAGMRNQEIADRLFIGLATVKRHVANAYGKLGVNHRTEAVALATELKLL